MAYLDSYTAPLTSQTAAHLLRRATFGPTNQEIADFTGKTATQAVDLLISNSSRRASPPDPIVMNGGQPDSGQTFLDKPLAGWRAYEYFLYIRYWWIGLMTEQTGYPSVLEKLTAFWQNHFVTAHSVVGDYRFTFKYIQFLRANATGNFRALTTEMTKQPSMLVFQNGFENTKESPNENYGRELQELFTVGQKDFAGNDNYTEQDVKAAARVLTGWGVTNYWTDGSTTFGTVFNSDRHDTTEKVFSAKYGNTRIAGKSGATAGDAELNELVSMLLAHTETPKFICRKLYRWYVNPNVTQDIEDNVIVPLAGIFRSSNWEILPVLRKLLTSQIFYASGNVGAIVKSPAEFMIGMLRHFNQPVPDMRTDYVAFRMMMEFQEWAMSKMQLSFLDQPLVFGSIPYYQTGFSKNWINGTTLGLRGNASDSMAYPWLLIRDDYMIGIDFIGWIKRLQPNFSDVAGTPAISADKVVSDFIKNLFAIELKATQKDFLIDSIFMRGVPRITWEYELNAYRAAPNDGHSHNPLLWRCQPLMVYLLRMAEYQVF